MTPFNSHLLKNTINNVIRVMALASCILLPPLAVYNIFNGGDTILSVVYAFVLLNGIFANFVFLSNTVNRVILAIAAIMGMFVFQGFNLQIFLLIMTLSLIFAYFFEKEKSLKETLITDHLFITDENFLENFKKISVTRENYYFLLKICYYKSKLNWLDSVLNHTYYRDFSIYREFNSLLFQFILWADFNAYEILRKNNFFIDEDGFVNTDDLVDLIHYYNYDEKFPTLLKIYKDVYKEDNLIYEKINTSSFGDEEMLILERLNLEASLSQKEVSKPKVLKI